MNADEIGRLYLQAMSAAILAADRAAFITGADPAVAADEAAKAVMAAIPATPCRHCEAPIHYVQEFDLWFHTDRPARGATWCSRNPDLQHLERETTAAPSATHWSRPPAALMDLPFGHG